MLLIVAGSIGLLKFIVGFRLNGTSVTLLSGTLEVSVGAVVSAVAPVVNFQTKLLAAYLVTISWAIKARASADLSVLVIPLPISVSMLVRQMVKYIDYLKSFLQTI